MDIYFSQYIVFVLYVQPVFWVIHHLCVVHLILSCFVPCHRRTFLIWCTICFPMRVFFSIPLILDYAAGRCTHHATPVGRRRWAGLQLAKSFWIYVCFRLQLPSAGVQAMFGINVLVLTSKSHTSGVCNRLLVHLCQWKRPRGVESDPGKDGAQTQWSAQGLGSHSTFG